MIQLAHVLSRFPTTRSLVLSGSPYNATADDQERPRGLGAPFDSLERFLCAPSVAAPLSATNDFLPALLETAATNVRLVVNSAQ